MADEIELIDLNEADIETLTTLPGIGPNLAERIVEFRVTVHPFEETIELAAVPGISERMVRQFEDRVTVKYSAPVESDADAGDELAAAEDSAEETVMTGVGIDETRLAESEEPAAEEEIESVPEAEEGELEPAPSPDEPETEVESEDGGAVEAVEAEESVEGEIGLAEAPPPPEAEPVDAADVEEPTAVEAQVSEKVEPPAAAVSDGEQGARRRGCIVLVIATLLGTVLGTTLTLVILATLNNGTLYFTQADVQLRRDINNANQVQAALDTDLARLTSRLDDVATRIEEMAEEQSSMEQSLENLLADINEIRGDIVSLEGSIEEVDDKLATVAAAAETFDTFLNRLRDLLIDIQGPPPTPTPTSTATSTPSPTPSATPASEEESILEVSPTSTARATRTPRPTATPFAQPTSTPEPQP